METRLPSLWQSQKHLESLLYHSWDPRVCSLHLSQARGLQPPQQALLLGSPIWGQLHKGLAMTPQ